MLRVVAFPAFGNRHGNPYTALLYEHVIPFVREISDYHHLRLMPKNVDIIHVHWPDLTISGRNLPRVAARSMWLLGRLAIGKLNGAKIIWTVHNLVPHDHSNRYLSRIYWKLFFDLLDGAIFLTARAREQARSVLPALHEKPVAIIPHGHYRPVMAATTYQHGKRLSREKHQLPQDQFIYLYFGRLRDYKNVEQLVQEFLALNEPDALLLIAGFCGANEERRQWLLEVAAAHKNIRLDLRHVPEATLFEYLEACDLVVLPFKKILNSGSVMMALSADRPVVAPHIGSVAEVADQVGRDWLISYDGAFDRQALVAGRIAASKARSPLDLSFFDWQPIARQTADFYQRVRDDGNVGIDASR
jgi:glycosyltransferase involved in cell wall biosynthesis